MRKPRFSDGVEAKCRFSIRYVVRPDSRCVRSGHHRHGGSAKDRLTGTHPGPTGPRRRVLGTVYPGRHVPDGSAHSEESIAVTVICHARIRREPRA